jgi:hypothetical protein
MNAELTLQQQLTLEMVRRQYDARIATRNKLDDKAGFILQSGGLVVTLTGAVSIPAMLTQSATGWALGGLAFAFLIFLAMILSALLAWKPSPHNLVGTHDWGKLFDDYINETPERCFERILSDLVGAIGDNSRRNERKAWLVQLAGWLFALQVTGILALAVAAAYMP